MALAIEADGVLAEVAIVGWDWAPAMSARVTKHRQVFGIFRSFADDQGT